MTSYNPTYYKYLFLFAAVFNWLITVSWAVAYPQIFSLLGIAPVTEPLFLHLFLALAFIFGIGYYRVGNALKQGSDVILLGVIGKIAVFVVILWYWLASKTAVMMLVVGTGDLIFALLFIEYLNRFSKLKNNQSELHQ